MAVEQLWSGDVRYLNIVAWKLCQKVNEGTEWSVKREYEVDGNKGSKWELQYKNLSGFITWLDFKESPYGEMFVVTIELDWEMDKLTVNSDSRYFSDLGRKLPNIDLKKPITLNPYDFESNGKQIRWLDIRQDWVKIWDNYFDFETKTAKNWMPEVNKDDLKEEWKDYWKWYFLNVNKFLKKEIKKVEIPNVVTDTREVEKNIDWEEIDPSDIPF